MVNLLYRPKTQDPQVFREVIGENCYRLPQKFEAADVIVDVGAHVGFFSCACLFRGAGEVWCFEPDKGNVHYLKQNITRAARPEQKHAIYEVAVWGDANCDLTYSGHPAWATACGSLLPCCTVEGTNDKIKVGVIALDTALACASQHGQRRVRLLKIDAEGAEWPALGTARKLDCVDEITGELHELTNLNFALAVPGFVKYNADEMCALLEEQGFRVTLARQRNQKMVLFWAKRPKEDSHE